MSQGNASRRDFMKLAAGSLGGALLGSQIIGCGGTGGGGGGGLGGSLGATPLPSGYTFYRLYSPPETTYFPDLTSLNGGVLNNDSTILFHGLRSTGQVAVYELDIDYSSGAPNIDSGEVLISEGDGMPDGTQVDRLYAAANNNQGLFSSFVCVATNYADATGTTPSRNGTPGLYVNLQKEGFQRVVSHGDAGPNGIQYGGNFGDVAINDNNDILFVNDYSVPNPSGIAVMQGLFLLPNGANPQNTVLLAQGSSADPNVTGLPNRLGLCDIDNEKNFVVQAASSSGVSTLGSGPAPMLSGLLGGRKGGEAELLIGSLPGRRPRTTIPGNVYIGPRIRGGNYTAVVHTSDSNQTLTANGNVLTQTGGNSPNGSNIIGIGPASISGNGLLHYLLGTGAGMELVVSNGTSQMTILSYNNSVGGAQIRGIVHGMHSAQSDSQGRIVFVGEFADGSQSIVVGVPN